MYIYVCSCESQCVDCGKVVRFRQLEHMSDKISHQRPAPVRLSPRRKRVKHGRSAMSSLDHAVHFPSSESCGWLTASLICPRFPQFSIKEPLLCSNYP